MTRVSWRNHASGPVRRQHPPRRSVAWLQNDSRRTILNESRDDKKLPRPPHCLGQPERKPSSKHCKTALEPCIPPELQRSIEPATLFLVRALRAQRSCSACNPRLRPQATTVNLTRKPPSISE